jgi:hypothetical protein
MAGIAIDSNGLVRWQLGHVLRLGYLCPKDVDGPRNVSLGIVLGFTHTEDEIYSLRIRTYVFDWLAKVLFLW